MSHDDHGEPIHVLIVDDQALVRMGLRMVLQSDDGITVVGEAADGDTAMSMTRALHPDVVLLDIQMPGMNGLEATAHLTAELPDSKVLIMTTFDRDDYVYSALRSGASGFLLKDADPPTMIAAVRAVAAGDAVVAPAITRRLLERFAGQLPSADRPHPARHPGLDGLTPREREVLELVGKGLSNAEIAHELYVSPATAKSHVGSMLSKLQLRDRVHLVILAYETGLVRSHS
jgi:DNA-binding NarL/FixJ family response regulator